MDKPNQISVRINGEDSYLERSDDPKEQESNRKLFEKAQAEQASAVEEEQEDSDESAPTISVIERPSKKKKRSIAIPLYVKQLAVAGISALAIGLVLGVVMLRLMSAAGGNVTEGVRSEAAVPASQYATTSNNQPFTFSAVDGYIVQVGVYSTVEKAEEWQQVLVSKGVETLTWQQDGQVTLVAGVAPSLDQAQKIGDALKTKGVETYSKSWSVPSVDASVSQAEGSWVQEGMNVWANLVTEATTGSEQLGVNPSIEKWLQGMPDETREAALPLRDEFKELATLSQSYDGNPTEAGLMDIQMKLVGIWKSYETYLQKS
ncbi:hypothetical protein N781_10605 [Pontibacillus halophilus JSM 076056 = DSM 19796]|uniref:SPOR domain-containing protein n=1 Tax=Pontibacillus halophilus JSM 076056 = DSM 19796 TaxID=1385510 RepID=A0A0A5GNT5_9BACI|nr:SPOR domain-containing protein [Pontibacillus halophilus]KGX93629.1 hypothetical protein N781_10605 [Pontibacillus halophilus JSM 076056 = DSM 19796]